MRYRPIQAARGSGVPFTLWGHIAHPDGLGSGGRFGGSALLRRSCSRRRLWPQCNQISIGDATVTEGGDLVFTITREHDRVATYLTSQALNWSTANGTATARVRLHRGDRRNARPR